MKNTNSKEEKLTKLKRYLFCTDISSYNNSISDSP